MRPRGKDTCSLRASSELRLSFVSIKSVPDCYDTLVHMRKQASKQASKQSFGSRLFFGQKIIFFILIHGDGDWFFLERFFVFYQSIESLISQSFSVFHIGDRVIIHDFIKVSSSTFFNPGGCTPHEIHI